MYGCGKIRKAMQRIVVGFYRGPGTRRSSPVAGYPLLAPRCPEVTRTYLGYAPATSGPLCSPQWGQFSTNVFKRQGTSNAGVPACSSRAGKPELLLRKATSVKT